MSLRGFRLAIIIADSARDVNSGRIKIYRFLLDKPADSGYNILVNSKAHPHNGCRLSCAFYQEIKPLAFGLAGRFISLYVVHES